MPRNCSASTADGFTSPFAASRSSRTCHRFAAYRFFQSVTGATSLIGRRPTESELITTAGRVFLISAPSVGSKQTSQISPRLGDTGLVLYNVAALPLGPLGFAGWLFIQVGNSLRLF